MISLTKLITDFFTVTQQATGMKSAHHCLCVRTYIHTYRETDRQTDRHTYVYSKHLKTKIDIQRML